MLLSENPIELNLEATGSSSMFIRSFFVSTMLLDVQWPDSTALVETRFRQFIMGQDHGFAGTVP